MSQDNEVLVKVEGVSKIFCRDLKKSLLYGLQDSARDLFSFGKSGSDRPPGASTFPSPAGGSSTSSQSKIKNQKSSIVNPPSPQRPLRPGEFFAVNDVSFELRRGECLGLIGRNGAGKTTLLKMLNGLIKPDAGRIEMRGRVGALIALGAGFNPILSGRENIYVNGSILGLSKAEIDAKIDEIIDFAEIGEFIDAPVQSYSSGMQVRLGFAVAVTLIQPDVLILDEVLAVGDTQFRIKCLTKIAELTSTSATIFVSHDSLQISRACNRVIWLSKGALMEESINVNKTLSKYANQSTGRKSGEVRAAHSQTVPVSDLIINGFPIQSPGVQPVLVDAKMPLNISFVLPPLARHQDATIKILIIAESGEGVAEIRGMDISYLEAYPQDAVVNGSCVKIQLKNLQIADGLYDIRMIVGAKNALESLLFVECLVRIQVEGNGHAWCRNLLPATWEIRA